MRSRSLEELPSAKRGASLRTLLIYPFVILIVVAVILTGFVSLYNSGKAAEHMAWQLMAEIEARIEDRLLLFLDRAHLVNEINANAIESKQIDLNDMEEQKLHFWHQVRSFDYISYSYIGRADGGFFGARRLADGTLQSISTETLTGGKIHYFNTDNQGLSTTISSSLPYYDHKTRPWYKAGIEAKKPTWSPVFIDAGGEGLTITAATPLYDDAKTIKGVLGCSFIFSHINQFLRTLKIGESGLTFIIERSGMLVATSTLDATYTADQKRIVFWESENPRISQTGKYISDQFGDLGKIDLKQRLSFHVQGERNFVQLSPLTDHRGIDWIIVAIIPENDFMSHIQAGNFNTVLLSLVALGMTIVVGFTIARRITRPILELNIAARSLAGGDWSQDLKIDRRDEVGELARSFNHMVRNLQTTTVSRDRLAEEIEERNRVESELHKLAAVVEHSSEFVILAALDGRMIFLNEAGGRMLGIPLRNVKDYSIMELIPDELKFKFENEVLPTILKEGRWEGDLQYCNLLTGTLIDVHAMTFTIRGSNSEPLYLANVSLDITERKRAEKALQKSEREEAILNQIANVFLTIPDEKIYEEVLVVILKELKCRYGIFGYVGDNGDLIVPSMTKEIWSDCKVEGKSNVFPRHLWGNSFWGKAIKEKKSFCSDGPFQIPDGHLPVYNFLTVPLVFMDKSIGLASVANKDGGFTTEDKTILELIAAHISPILNTRLQRDERELERKRAEEELKDSEQLLKSIIHGYPIPTFMIGQDHRVIHWNRALEEFTGLGASAVIGTSLHWRAFYREERPCMADLLVNEDREAISGWYGERTCKSEVLEEAYEATEFFPDLGGTGKWLRFTAAAIRNSRGIILGAIETLEDITDRERAEEVLKESENRYRAIFENTGTATIILEEDTIISLANAEFEKLTGYTRDEIENKKSWTTFIEKEDLEKMLGQHRLRRTETNIALKQYEFRLIDRHNRIKHCLLSIEMIADTKKSIASILDITERKQAEDALISKNRELNDIIEFLPDATFVMDKDKKVIAWNRAIEEMTGVSKRDMIGQPHSVCAVPFYGESRTYLLDLIDVSDRELESKYGNIERKGGILCGETHVPCIYGGRGAFVFATAAHLFDAHGNRVGAIESIRDITESKKKEEALQESQQQLADMINFLPDATLVIDKAGKVIAWNRAMEEMTGINAADMLGKDDFEYALPFYGERRPILIDLVLRPREEVETEYDYVERRGTVIAGETYFGSLRGREAYLFGKASALFDSKGNIVGAIESIRDISERKRVEKALVQAEEKYRGIFENAMEGIYQTTPDGRFISVNPALAHILGYDSPEEILNSVTDIAHQIYVNPEHRDDLLRLLTKQGAVHNFETQFFRKNGSIAWVTLNIRAVCDKSGRISFLEGTTEDISERKVLEGRLFQVQKMEAIGTLAGGIAHDFNNILAPIIGYSELALQNIPEDTRLYHNMQQVILAGYRARDLVKQILAFSRKAEQKRGPVQVSTVIKETHQMLKSTLPSTIEIRRNIDSDASDSTIMADPTQIHQVVMNLCTNAAHAMREKGGVLSMTLAKVEIDATPDSEIPGLEYGSYLRLSISDTGHGMDDEVKERIFEPYFTTKGPDEGTGLGLAVVYGIVKGLSGGITVSSSRGQGTTFQVFFPIAESSEKSAVNVPCRLLTGNGRILVVDDEIYVVEMQREMLEQLGYEVAVRYSSADALRTFEMQPERFDLIITDQTMPHMTGTDLAKEMLKIRPEIPIILCTGFSAMVDEAKARKIGIRAFLMKPIALQQLAEEIHRLLNQE